MSRVREFLVIRRGGETGYKEVRCDEIKLSGKLILKNKINV